MTSLSRMLTVSCHNLFAFDGTGNAESSYTNVYLLYESYGGSALGEYYSGVGIDDYTDPEGVASQIRQGVSLPDIKLTIHNAITDYNDLKGLSSTEDVCIDVVGFSRGAVTAVEFVRKLGDKEQDMAARVRFLGFFDLVHEYKDYQSKLAAPDWKLNGLKGRTPAGTFNNYDLNILE